MTDENFRDMFARAKSRDSYWTAKATHEFTEALCILMERRGVSRQELARRTGGNPAYISKLLRGDINLSLASMVRLARALGGELSIHLDENSLVLPEMLEVSEIPEMNDAEADPPETLPHVQHWKIPSHSAHHAQL